MVHRILISAAGDRLRSCGRRAVCRNSSLRPVLFLVKSKVKSFYTDVVITDLLRYTITKRNIKEARQGGRRPSVDRQKNGRRIV